MRRASLLALSVVVLGGLGVAGHHHPDPEPAHAVAHPVVVAPVQDEIHLLRASRSRRAPSPIPVARRRHPRLAVDVAPVGDFAHSVRGIKIANCESADLQHWPYSDGTHYLGGEKGVHLHDQALYTGKWQIGPSEWRDWGGLRFAAHPWQATEAQQDIVADVGYSHRGEEPWDCRKKV